MLSFLPSAITIVLTNGSAVRPYLHMVALLSTLLRSVDFWPIAPIRRAYASGDDRINWFRIWPFVVLHLAAFGMIRTGASATAIAVCVAMYLVRMFGITAFYHRYFSHRSYRMSRGMQFIAAVIGNSAAQRGPLWWAAHHRYHHQHADTPDDLHSPSLAGFWKSHIGWILENRNYRTRLQLVPDLARFPELRFLDRYDWMVPVLTAAAMFGAGHALAIFAPQLHTNGAQLFVWGFCVSTVLLFHGTFVINSLAHIWGTRRYDLQDDSRNNLVLSLITLGEGWHNNHHNRPGRTRQGVAWWEIDVTWYVLRALSWLRLVWGFNP